MFNAQLAMTWAVTIGRGSCEPPEVTLARARTLAEGMTALERELASKAPRTVPYEFREAYRKTGVTAQP